MENQPTSSIKAISSTVNDRERVLWEKESVIKTPKPVEMENEALSSMETISSTVNDRERVLWEKEAVIQSTKVICENLKQEISTLNTSIASSEKEIENVRTEIEQLNYCYDVLKDSINSDIHSLINQKLYVKSLEKQLTEYKQKVHNVANEYTQFVKDEEQRLQAENSLYRELQGKRIKVKLEDIEIRTLSHKIVQQKQKNDLKLKISTKLFYENIITFARNCLLQSDYNKALKELEIVKQRERDSLKELLEVQELVKKSYNTSYYFTKPNLPNREIQSNTLVEKEISLNDDDNENNRDLSTTEHMDTNNALDMDSKNIEKLNSILNQPNHDMDAIRKEYSANHEKVRIIDDVLIKPPPPPLTQNKPSKSKKITQKIHDFVNNLSRSPSLESLIRKPQKLNTRSKLNSPPKINPKTELDQSSDSDTSMTQEYKKVSGNNDIFRQEMFNQSQQNAYKMQAYMQQQNQCMLDSRVVEKATQQMENFQSVPVKNVDQQKMFSAQGSNKMPQFSFLSGSRPHEQKMHREDSRQIDFQSQLLSRNTPKKTVPLHMYQPKQVPNNPYMTMEKNPSAPNLNARPNTFQMGVLQGPATFDGQSMGYYETSLENTSLSEDTFPAPKFSPLGSPDNTEDIHSFMPFPTSNDENTHHSFNFSQPGNRFNLF